MNINQLLSFITIDPVNLSIKSKLISVFSCSCAILFMALITQHFSDNTAYPIIVASMGASAIILFIMPHSPVAQPWSLIGGHLISAIVGITCSQLFTNIALASACAVGGSVFAMLLLRCLHPPGAATALTLIVGFDPIGSADYSFVFMPLGLNVVIMLVMAIIINRWVLAYEYPVVLNKIGNKQHIHNPLISASQLTGVSEQDLEQALENMDMFMDVTQEDLSKLFTDAEKQSFKRFRGNITCGNIMLKDVPAVEYGTEVEEAWNIMHGKKLKAMPVINKSRRIIGIITWSDFFKFISIKTDATFQERFLAFIRRTPGISTDKPESVGHIMASSVAVLPETAHIAELIPLMSNLGYRQIPIVNSENRLVGMVYQANLIAALYNDRQTKLKIPI